MNAFKSMRAQAMSGFTLVELMIVVVVLTMLAAIAIPSYSNQIRKSRRSEAKSALLDLAGREERYMATNGTYTSTPSNLGYSSFSGIGSGYYDIAITNVTAPTAPTATKAGIPATYTLTATVTTLGAQNKDTNCLAFQVNSLGQQTSYNTTTAGSMTTANATTGCW
jgi:type IV pilus assembly protein PilE